jgi:hypothetical protein
MATSDSPVRIRHSTVHCPVRATSADRWGLELLTVEFVCTFGAPDSPVAYQTVRCDLTSQTASDFWRSDCGVVDRWEKMTVAPWAHWTVRCTSDSPVNFSRGTLRIHESVQFAKCSSLGTGHCPVHTGQSGAPQVGANQFSSILVESPQGLFLCMCIYELYAPEKISTRQTS